MTFDVADAVTAIAAITAGIALIGGAKLLPAAASVGWKWMKGALFG